MRWSEITVYVTILVALALWWVWVAASRLDRLHRKVNSSRAVLDAQLVRRATVTDQVLAVYEMVVAGRHTPVGEDPSSVRGARLIEMRRGRGESR